MSTKLEFDWSKEEIIDDELFNPDFLERSKYAEFLTSYLYGQDKGKSYVLNLNSGWGTGKTYFLKRWKYDLDKHHPVIYIDAWKDDHSDDPFLSVVSSLITQLRAKTDKNEGSMLSKSFEFGSRLVKQVAPILIGGLAKKYIGVALDEMPFGNDEKPSNSNDKIDQVAQKISGLLLSDHEKRMSSITALKKTIKLWIDAVIGQNSQGNGKLEEPTFIIIDELDRCRPDYAVKTLEVVKHIFDIPGVFFVIATDTEQLQHAIKVVYGSDFNAHIYLSRFFDARFSLRQESLKTVIDTHCKKMKAFDKEYQRENEILIWPQSYNDVQNIVAVLDVFEMPARNAIQIVNRISSILLFAGQKEKFDILYLTTLLCLQVSDYSLYLSFIGIKKLGVLGKLSMDIDWLESSMLISFYYSEPKDVGHHIKRELPLRDYYMNTFALYSEVLDVITYDEGWPRSDNKNFIVESVYKHSSENDKSPISPYYSDSWLRYSYLMCGLNEVDRNKYISMIEMAKSFD